MSGARTAIPEMSGEQGHNSADNVENGLVGRSRLAHQRLQWALQAHAKQAALFAIQMGASINAKGNGEYDCTPLDIAVRHDNDHFVDMFLRYGAIGSAPATSKRMELISRGKEALKRLMAEAATKSFDSTIKHFQDVLGVPAKKDKQTGFTRFPFLTDYYTAGAANPKEIDVPSLIAQEIADDNALQIVYHAF